MSVVVHMISIRLVGFLIYLCNVCKRRKTGHISAHPDVPELHDLYGKEFKEKYEYYESLNLPRAKKINSFDLWRKMLTMLFETGHPWFYV